MAAPWLPLATARVPTRERLDRHKVMPRDPPRPLLSLAVTMLGVLLASTLFCHELSWYLSPKAHSKMEVDLRRHRDLAINVDVTFHAVPCAGGGGHARAPGMREGRGKGGWQLSRRQRCSARGRGDPRRARA